MEVEWVLGAGEGLGEASVPMAAVATQPPKQAQHERSMVGKKQNTQCNQSFSTPIKRSNVTPLFVNFKGKILWF